MPGVQGEPPAVARQRVRRALRKAREATALSQGDVAKRLGWSLSKVQRIEGGEVGVSVTDLRALLEVYGITDPQLIERLSEDARTSRRQRYLTAPEFREHLTASFRELMQFEQEAVSIRAYQPVFYPGLLQTPAVAESILLWWNETLTEEARRVIFDVRMARRKQVLGREDGPEYFLILDESVIKRRIAGIKTTLEQLEEVVALAQRPNIHIRIVPFAKGAYMGALGPFQILDVDFDESILYREIYNRDELIHDLKEVNFHRDAFEHLWKVSLSEDATLRAVVAEAALLRSALDYNQVA